MKKKILSAILLVAMLLTTLSAITFGVYADEETVTVTDWTAANINLNNAADVQAFFNKLSERSFIKQFIYLKADVDMATKPIAKRTSSMKAFSGYFDGQDHVIANITVECETLSGSSATAAGLFGGTVIEAPSVIRNVAFTNATYKGGKYGGLFYSECCGNSASRNLEKVYMMNVFVHFKEYSVGKGGSGDGALFGNIGVDLTNVVVCGNIDCQKVAGVVGCPANDKGTNRGTEVINFCKNVACYITFGTTQEEVEGEMKEVTKPGCYGFTYNRSTQLSIDNCISFCNARDGKVFGHSNTSWNVGKKSICSNEGDTGILYTIDSASGEVAAMGDDLVRLTPNTTVGTVGKKVLAENGFAGWTAMDNTYPLPTTLAEGVFKTHPELLSFMPVVEPAQEQQEQKQEEQKQEEQKQEEQKPADNTPTTDPVVEEKKGCGATVTGGVALLLSFSAAAVCIKRKKEY